MASRGRRQIVWTFICERVFERLGPCGERRDFLAKRRPTSPDPSEDLPKLVKCVECGCFMRNEGLFYLALVNGEKVRERASAIRREWDHRAEAFFRGKMCRCGHEWWMHRKLATYRLGACVCGTCVEFDPVPPAPVEIARRPEDDEVPF